MNNGFTQAPMEGGQNNLWNGAPRPNEYVNTNISLVTSLEEALIKSTVRGSDTVHFHQSKDVFYRIRVDWDGRKYWKEIPYGDTVMGNTDFVTRKEFTELVDKVNALSSNPGISLEGGAMNV